MWKEYLNPEEKESWWKNTLLVVVADHGHRFPGLSANYEINKYKIPMLWIGGALKSKGKISKLASQNDIDATLLSQLNISSNDYIFSKNIIGKQPAFAYYVFNNGFGIIKDSSAVIFDCTSNRPVYSAGNDRQQIENIGKAYIQDIYTDLENR